MNLGKLEKVDLRSIWKKEAIEFSPWLATEEGLSLLSDEIGIDIKLVQTEASVGSFNVDILAEGGKNRTQNNYRESIRSNKP